MIENIFCMRIYAVPCSCSTMPGGMGLDQMMKTTKVLVFFCMGSLTGGSASWISLATKLRFSTWFHSFTRNEFSH